jgi:hypothetical protein
LTYNGPSGYFYFYATGAGFLTDTVGTYDFFFVFLNGTQDPSNLQATFAGATTSVVTGLIQNSRIDFLQVAT